MNELLEDFTVVVDLNIEWGDMDALQHVNNIEYFKYFQVARITYFEKIASDGVLEEKRIPLILASTKCKFIYPLAYPDSISVGVRVDAMADQYFTMKYAVVSHRHKRLAAIGDAKVVVFDYISNKKVSIPDEIRKTIIDFEKSVDEVVEKD